MTRRETFESLEDIWFKEVDMYSTVEGAVKMVVANKVDKVSGSAFTRAFYGACYVASCKDLSCFGLLLEFPPGLHNMSWKQAAVELILDGPSYVAQNREVCTATSPWGEGG